MGAETDVLPVLVLGGDENALSIVRSLGRRGIPVYASGPDPCAASRSRFCAGFAPVGHAHDAQRTWRQLLVERRMLRGAVLLACSDDAIAFLAEHHDDLAAAYALPVSRPGLQRALLDKHRTLELARDAGVPVPGFWRVETLADARRAAREATFPLIVKPLSSHRFQRAYGGRRYLPVRSPAELDHTLGPVLDRGTRVMLCERIPGPDSLLSSYYTFFDAGGEPRFHFTKRVLRRLPMNEGGATYHIVDWLPETARLGQRFFAAIGFRGLGNIELKRDTRDGELKVIECNARFTAAQELLVRAGLDTALWSYCSATGAPLPEHHTYVSDLRMWYPLRDLGAFRELRARGLLSAGDWLRSVATAPVLPYFDAGDPWPAISRVWSRSRARAGRTMAGVKSRWRTA